jgi:hypothetical protein
VTHTAEENQGSVYRQEDGRITARFPDQEEKMVLSHEGHPLYRKIFYFLVTVGCLYLVFTFCAH